jgi:hypothetical protein
MSVLEITIQRRGEAGFPVVAELTVGGQMPTRSEGLLQLDRVELLALLDPLSYGTLLGQGVLSRGVRDTFVRARSGGETVHVLLFVEAPELRDLRWERLCAPLDDDRWDFLARDPRVPLSIHLPTATDRRFPPCGRADMRALVLVASPPGLERFGFSPFDAAGALRSVREGLGDIPHDCLAEGPGSSGPPTLRALTERLVAGHYTMLHVVCHGLFKKDDGETAILIAGDDGRAEPVTAARLITQLRGIGGARGLPRFVFLATCESADPRAEGALGGLAHRLVRDLGVPAVIAMTEKVSQVTALALGKAFYPRLREHGEVDRALVEALSLIGERFDAAVPAVFSRLAGRPLFTDDPGRAPTPTELRRALDAFAGLLPIRAPALVSRFEALARQLRPLVDAEDEALAGAARRERVELLEQFDALCEEVADVSSTALAFGKAPPAYDATCPFPGLQAFRGDESRFFFGRDALIERLGRELQGAPFLAVLGQSGSGKSSAVLAGLVPRLVRARPGLAAVTIVPGAEPTARLAQALEDAGLAAALARASQPRRRKGRPSADATPPAVLVVDQLEEAFTLCTDAERRAQFFAQLLALSDELPVVVTLRADFLGEVAPHVDLRTAIERHQVIVAPMTPTEMRAAIEQQAAAVGLRFDGDLMATILADVQAEPGAMPLLQHALLELWRRRHGRWLRADEYRALGGVSRAIAETADTIFRELDDDDRDRVRRLFTRLTRVDVDAAAGGERRDTRRRLALVELVPAGEDPAPTSRLIARLAGDRLLVTAIHPQTGEETVEVSHEALIRRWPRLQTWLDEDLDGMRKTHQLGEAAAAWSEAGRGADLIVHRGVRLVEVQELAASGRFPLNRREAEYLAACVETAERSRREEEAARARELEQARAVADAQRQRAEAQEAATRAIRRRARIIAVIGVLAVVTAIASVVLYRRSEQALADASASRRAAEEAQQQAEAGEAHAHDALLVSTVDRIEGDVTRQALVLREVGSLGEDPRWDQHLIRIASEARAISGFDEDLLVERSGLVLDGTGERILTLARGGVATLRTVAGPSVRWTAALGEQRAGSLLVAGGGVLSIGLDSLSYVPLVDAVAPAGAPPVIDIRASRLHDVAVHGGRTRALVSTQGDGPSSSCDLAVVEVDTSVRTAETRCILADATFTAAALLPGPDLALVHGSGRFSVHPLSGGPGSGELPSSFRSFTLRLESTISEGDAGLHALVRNADGTRVALVGSVLPPPPAGQPAAGRSEKTGQGGDPVLTMADLAGVRPTVEVWRIEASALPTRIDSRAFEREPEVVFDGDEPLAVEAEKVWTHEHGEWSIAAEFPGERRGARPLTFSPATRILALGLGPDVLLFEPASHRIRELRGHTTGVRDLAFSADGRRLASSDATTVRVWDTGAVAGELSWTKPGFRILDVARDGRRVMIGASGPDTMDGDAIIVSVEEPEAPRRIAGEILDARFLPDGATAVARMVEGSELVIGVASPGGGLQRLVPEEAWRADLVFSDPARAFFESTRGVAWGVRPDGRAWQASPPGDAYDFDTLLFAPTGARALLLGRPRPHDDVAPLAHVALLARSGELTELLGAPPLPADGRAQAALWSPDGARVLVVYFTADGACAVHWAPDEPAGARRTCVRADEVPGGAAALAESRRGAAWSPDGSLIACTLGEGNLLIPTAGDAPPRWLGSGSRREPTTLRFDPGGDLLVESTSRGVYVWPLDGEADAPVTLVEYEPSAPLLALREVPVADGLVTVALADRLTVRRWKLARGNVEALTANSPFCLEPAWRAAYLHETSADARTRYCACRLSFKTPDDVCSSP